MFFAKNTNGYPADSSVPCGGGASLKKSSRLNINAPCGSGAPLKKRARLSAVALALGLVLAPFASGAAEAQTFTPTLDQSAVQNQVETEIENTLNALPTAAHPGFTDAEWATYVAGYVSNLDISSAYTVTDITGTTPAPGTYFTTFTVQEADATGVVTSTTYGVKFKGSGAAGSPGETASIPELIKDYLANKIDGTQGSGNTHYTIIQNGDVFTLNFKDTAGTDQTATLTVDAAGAVSFDGTGTTNNRREGSTIGDLTENFIGNSGGALGGAISNSGIITTLTGDFIGNSANASGGAISNNGTITTLSGDFIGNTATSENSTGGAINNSGTIATLTGDFIGNSANNSGGAIYNYTGSTITTLIGDFIGNTATSKDGTGGAIYNSGTITTLTGDFIGNRSANGGAIYNNGSITTLTGDFIGNTADSGGAIYNNRNTITTLTGDFIGNTATGTGGAIYNDGEGTITTLTGDFIGNSTIQSLGGAIDNKGVITTLSGDFIGNRAGSGGAIHNYIGTIETLSGDFIGNSAVINDGGAIYNDGGAIKTISGDFIGNSANNNGGAIWTNTDLTFKADGAAYTFSGNKDNDGYNAIFIGYDFYQTNPNPTLNFNLENGGTYTLDDNVKVVDNAPYDVTYDFSITGQNAANDIFYLNNSLYDAADVTVSGATLNMGSVTHDDGRTYFGQINAANVDFGADSRLVLNAANNAFANAAALNGTGTLTLPTEAALQIANGTGGQILHVTNNFTSGDVWKDTNVTSTSALFDVQVLNRGVGSYQVKLLADSDAKIFDYLDSGYVGMLAELQTKGVDTDASAADIRTISRLIDGRYFDQSDPQAVAAALDAAAHLGQAGGAVAGALGVNQSTLQTIDDRMLDGVAPAAASTGDPAAEVALWATPFYRHSSADGFSAGSFQAGFDANLFGLALGVDRTISTTAGDFRFGLATSLGRNHLNSDGDFTAITNDQDFWSANLYGSWQRDQFTLAADAGYTRVSNDLTQRPSSVMTDLKADPNTDTFTVGLRGEYLFRTASVDITPHLGLRYYNINTDAYATTTDGGTVFNVAEDGQNLWQAPVGLTFSKEMATDGGWLLTPALELGAVISFGDTDSTSLATAPSFSGSTAQTVSVVDDVAFAGGVSFDAAAPNSDFTFSFGYDLQVSEHTTDHAVSGTVRYGF